MRWLFGKKALSAIEYIIVAALVLAVVGTAIWNLAGAVAQKFDEFNNQL